MLHVVAVGLAKPINKLAEVSLKDEEFRTLHHNLRSPPALGELPAVMGTAQVCS